MSHEDQLPAVVTRHVHHAVLAVASLIILHWLWPEYRFAAIFYNDAISHSAIIRGMDEAWKNGGNITDFWMGYINFGHALLRSYQFLFHLVVWVAHHTIFASLDLFHCFNACVILMAMALPWCMYKGLRIFGLSRGEALTASVAMILIHERDGYGIGLTNWTFSGYGTYNQLFAMLFFPFTIGYARRLLRTGKGALATSLAFSATVMSHILTGYFACLWILIDALMMFISESGDRQGKIKQLARSTAKLCALCLLWTGHWIIPMAQDTILQHKSEFEAVWKWPGHGAEKMLNDFASGATLDADRFPSLTILSILGLLYGISLWIAWFRERGNKAKTERDEVRREVALQSVLWILLSFGTTTWGRALEILPFSGTLHWHRFFAGAQFSLMLGIGILLAAIARRVDVMQGRLSLGMFTAVITALVYPCFIERERFFWETNSFWLRDTYETWRNEALPERKLLDFALANGDARYHLGTPWSWGDKLRVSKTVQDYGLLVQFNVETVGAIHHHQNHSEVLAFRSEVLNPKHAELMNVRYVGLPPDQVPPVGYRAFLTTHNAVIYDNGNQSGYFALGRTAASREGCATNDILTRGITYFLKTDKLLDAGVFPRIRLAKSCDQEWTLEDEIGRLERELVPAPIPGRVLTSSVKAGPNSRIHQGTVEITTPGLLIFKMNYHPGWKAMVDGKPAPTMMIVPSYLGVAIEKGRHEISFEYEVAPLKRVLSWIAVCGFASLIVFGAWSALRQLKLKRGGTSKINPSADAV